MKQCISAVVAAVMVMGLTACSGQASRDAQAAYILDLDREVYCIEGTRQCQLLSLIRPAFGEHEIAAAFGLPKGYYSWQPEALSDLLMNPPRQQYRVESLGNQRYRIPARFETHLVWDTLAQEDYRLYLDEDDWKDIPPPLRRF